MDKKQRGGTLPCEDFVIGAVLAKKTNLVIYILRNFDYNQTKNRNAKF